MKIARQWALMLTGFLGAFLVGLTVFFLVFFPSCAPEFCIRYSPSVRQVVTVVRNTEDIDIHLKGRSRIAKFGSQAMPVLQELLCSPKSTNDDRWAAILLFGDLKQDAQPMITTIYEMLPSLMASFDSQVLIYSLSRIGVTRDWQAGLTDPDPRISDAFWEAAECDGSVDGFLLCWDLLQADAVVNRPQALQIMGRTLSFPLLWKPLIDERIASRLDAVVANGPEDMREMANEFKARVR